MTRTEKIAFLRRKIAHCNAHRQLALSKELQTRLKPLIIQQLKKEIRDWADGNKDRIKVLPEDWQDILRLRYEEMMANL